ncbi:MAG: hypothetical protein ACI9FN_002289 [Saprospiraceae bacterium]
MLGYLILFNSPLLTCNACSCSTSYWGSGLITDYRSNFYRVSYFNSKYKSSPEHDILTSDRFSQVDLSFRYAIGKDNRIRVMAHVPYSINTRVEDGKTLSVKGLSDIRIIANYVAIDNIVISDKTKLNLEVGGGLSLPSGKYNAKLRNENLPENFNIGKGTLGYIFQLNAVLNLGKNGIVLNQSYQVNSDTKSGYHFGNTYNTQITAFREIEAKGFKLIPNLGLGIEGTSKDRYANGNNVPETGGKGLFLSPSINFKNENWLAGFTYSVPLAQEYAQGIVKAKSKIACYFSYFFKKNSTL